MITERLLGSEEDLVMMPMSSKYDLDNSSVCLLYVIALQDISVHIT